MTDRDDLAEKLFLAYKESVSQNRQTWAMVADAALAYINQPPASTDPRLQLAEPCRVPGCGGWC